MDAATNFLYVEYLKTKSSGEVRAAFDRFLRRYKRELDACRAAGFNVTWRTDNGGEFTSSDLDEFCEEFAVKRSFSVPYAPPQNAHAERMWGILLRTMRITIAESKISERFWTYAMQNAVRLHNSLPSTKLDNNMSPYQAFTGKLPNLGKFRVFGSRSTRRSGHGDPFCRRSLRGYELYVTPRGGQMPRESMVCCV